MKMMCQTQQLRNGKGKTAAAMSYKQTIMDTTGMGKEDSSCNELLGVGDNSRERMKQL